MRRSVKLGDGFRRHLIAEHRPAVPMLLRRDGSRLVDFARLRGEVVELGRDPRGEKGVTVNAEWVSASHLLFTRAKGRWYVRDLNSTNGTTLEGRRLSDEVRLRSGDTIVLGGRLEFVFLEERLSHTPTVGESDLDRYEPNPFRRAVLVALAEPMRADSLAQPASNAMIAERLTLSEKEIERQLHEIRRETGLQGTGESRRELAELGLRLVD